MKQLLFQYAAKPADGEDALKMAHSAPVWRLRISARELPHELTVYIQKTFLVH